MDSPRGCLVWNTHLSLRVLHATEGHLLQTDSACGALLQTIPSARVLPWKYWARSYAALLRAAMTGHEYRAHYLLWSGRGSLQQRAFKSLQKRGKTDRTFWKPLRGGHRYWKPTCEYHFSCNLWCRKTGRAMLPFCRQDGETESTNWWSACSISMCVARALFWTRRLFGAGSASVLVISATRSPFRRVSEKRAAFNVVTPWKCHSERNSFVPVDVLERRPHGKTSYLWGGLVFVK